MHLGVSSFYRLWSIIDLVIIIANIYIGIGVITFDHEQNKYWDKTELITIENMRVIESIGILSMWLKSLYYL